jgi:hypothetical protein
MKIVTKFAFAALLAISAVAPALAFEPEALTLEERNSYLYTSDALPIAKHQNNDVARAHRGTVDGNADYDYSVFRGY